MKKILFTIFILYLNSLFSLTNFSITSSDYINSSIADSLFWQTSKKQLAAKGLITNSSSSDFYNFSPNLRWCGIFPIYSKVNIKNNHPVEIEVLFWSMADQQTRAITASYEQAQQAIQDIKSYFQDLGCVFTKEKNRISNKAYYFSDETNYKGSHIIIVDNKLNYILLKISSEQYFKQQDITNDAQIRNLRENKLKKNLKANLNKSLNGDIIINNIPMIDQGRKGYCAPATIARVLKYYGISVDMYQLADLMNSDPLSGTSIKSTKTTLKKIASGRPLYVKELKFSFSRIKKYINQGIPVIWSIRHPAHLRMIKGYNEKKRELIYTDSWGERGEEGRISYNKAKAVTKFISVLK